MWLQYLQAIAVPFIGAVIAGTGAWIAFQQMRIAHIRLKHDLYDRRFATFEAARRLLIDMAVNGDASEEAMGNYLVGIANASFLFDDSLVRYLREIGEHASTVQVINTTLKGHVSGSDKPPLERQVTEKVEWLRNQIEVLDSKFMPFLRLERNYR